MSDRTPPSPPIDLPRPSPRRRRLIFVGLSIVASVLALVSTAALLLQAMGWTTFRQPGSSMRPGLLQDDYFMIDTGAYRDNRRPDYGDIIAFAVPRPMSGLPGAGPDIALAMRVIGLPGDRIEIAGGVVSVNGQVFPQELLGEFIRGRPGKPAEKGTRLRERAPNGVVYEILRYAGPGEGGAYVVPQGHYFVLGDNRDDALDSRFWAQAGRWYLPSGNVTGRANYIYWSGFDRLDRIGKALK